ncbi:MAG: DUF1573 domain-containing protein [Planctomycetota bacterium]|nr:MAG: DUF1573 domain-containing protein [Planctomycetota bacterium]
MTRTALPILLPLLLLASACGPGPAGPGPAAGPEGAAAAAAGDGGAGEYSSGSLRFSLTEIDLGEILQHEEHPLEFPFEVVGEEPVVVTEAAPSCGCTDVRLEVEGQPYVLGDPIPPGAHGRVVGTFESGTFKQLKKTRITVRGNGLDMPIELRVQAMIQPIFIVTPSQALFGEVKAGEEVEREVVVNAVADFQVERWITSPRGFVIEEAGPAEPAPDGKRILKRFRIRLTPDAEVRRHYGSFVADTSLGRRLEIVVQAHVFGPVRYQPDQRLTFGMLDRGTSISRRVQVRAAADPIPAPQAEILDSELFTSEVLTREEGQAYTVKVAISPDAPLGTHTARLRISFPDAADLPPHEIHVTAIVRDRS